MTPREARLALLAGVAGADLRGQDDLGGLISPPAVVVGPANVTYGVYNDLDPTSATFTVFAVVEADERSSDRLDELLPLAVAAICSSDADVVVRDAEQGFFLSGNTNLPCYRIRAEVAL